MTNIEMDDVLSSIRRLVSEGSETPTGPVRAKDDRFILTPALRVPDDADQKPAVVAQTQPPAELTGVLHAVVQAAKARPDANPPSPEFEAMETAWKAELARVAEAREAASGEGDPDQIDAPELQTLEHQIAELEEAVGQSQEDWEPDGSEPEAKQLPRRHIFEIVSNSGLQDDADADADAVDDDCGSDDSVPIFSHMSVTRPKPYLLSDSVPDADIGGDTSEPVTEPANHQTSDIVDDDDVFLDVEALRTMITEVVREELHGKLGETITRNVRKMIQQEIAQAITSQPSEDEF